MNNYNQIRNTVIGTVEFVSSKEIKVLIDVEAPASTSLNSGVPQLFPRVNGFLLIPNETGYIVGVITWIGTEYSPFPKRKGYKDFDLVDLPFPLRKLSLSPVGVLKDTGNGYEIERGVYSLPSVGDTVNIPTPEQLKAIVQNKDEKARIKIGNSPIAANAPIYVDPDKLFGRHLAVLGNTGSGKSCSVAGLIRWSIEQSKKAIEEAKKNTKEVNARFILFDPNGEYGDCFNDIENISINRYAVKLTDADSNVKQLKVPSNRDADSNVEQLKVPSWMWNSWEWASIAQASAKTQRPILRRALREIKNAENFTKESKDFIFKNFLTSLKISLLNYQKDAVNLSNWPGKQNYGEFLEAIKKSLETFDKKLNDEDYKEVYNKLNEITSNKPKNEKGYYPAFSLNEVNPLIEIIEESENKIGKLVPYEGPDEDSPVFFKNEDFLAHIERLAQEANQQQYLDFFLMRVRSLFTDARIASVINIDKPEDLTLENWLNKYIGSSESKPSITIIDLSLLPSEILFLVVSVMARLIFEAHHRFKKQNGNTLPTVMIVDEAHNLIKRYETDDDSISSQRLCTQIFEKIAKEGRKFGVGLVIASQRPSELSQTVLSQCNTFLLHRIVSDRDQEMVKKLVPDTMGGILNELSVLPSRKAILLGWTVPIPVLVDMNELSENQRPKSKDPEFWDVWMNNEVRDINWKNIANEWQEKKKEKKKRKKREKKREKRILVMNEKKNNINFEDNISF